MKAVVDDPTVSDKTDLTSKQSIQTWVQGLQPMVGSVNTNNQVDSKGWPVPGSGGPGYLFPPAGQTNHGNLYYGTAATIQSFVSIANEFQNAQIACQNGSDGTWGHNAQGQNFTTPGPPIPLIITAMCLPWGGLSDYQGDWNPPHGSHNDGKEVDIDLSNFQIGAESLASLGVLPDRLLLFLAVAQGDQNFKNFVSNEGGDLGAANTTLVPERPHIHINFKQ